MFIKQAHSTPGPIDSASPVSKPAAKANEPGSFSALFGSLAPSNATSSNYRPVGTIHGSAGPQSSTASTSTGSVATVPFVPVFQTGATVTAPDGSVTSLNPSELATPQTAQDVAALLNGTVTQDNPSGGFNTSISTLEISVPGSSVQINAGLAAKLFATYGTAAGSEAWQIIDRDLGQTT
jgi:hypothetical protein